MANHTSAIKSIRKNKSNQLRNRYKNKSARTLAKKFRNAITDAIQKGLFEESLYPQYKVLISKFDKLAKKKIIHKNRASNLKSKMTKTIASFLARSSNGKDVRFSS